MTDAGPAADWIEIQLDATVTQWVPAFDQLRGWAAELFRGEALEAAWGALTLRIVDEPEMTTLNGRYRGQPRPTNVLAFPAALPAEFELAVLGDVILCAPVIAREALEQGKPEAAHWAHMVVHGTLHLLGFDHEEADQARVMEALETAVLAQLGYPNPYCC